jgi:glucose-specific phosphotransferase system IIA component
MWFRKNVQVHVYPPFRGRRLPLSEVPDPVFSQKLVGDGYAMVPETGECLAPVNGTVTSVFDTKHAVCLKTKEGIDLLIHIGLDTVSLGGQPFQAHVKAGDKVRVGDRLITFDMEAIRKERSLVSPVLVTNMDRVQAIQTENSEALFTVVVKQ